MMCCNISKNTTVEPVDRIEQIHQVHVVMVSGCFFGTESHLRVPTERNATKYATKQWFPVYQKINLDKLLHLQEGRQIKLPQLFLIFPPSRKRSNLQRTDFQASDPDLSSDWDGWCERNHTTMSDQSLTTVDGGFKYFVYFHPYLGKMNQFWL